MRRRIGPLHGGTRRGFLLVMGNLVLVSLTTLLAAGLTRSMQEARAVDVFVTNQQAFYLAEGGLDQKLREFLDADPMNDTQTINPVTLTGGNYQVTVTPLGGNAWRVIATGTAGAATEVLRMTVTKGSPPLPILGATTVVGEGGRKLEVSFFSNSNPSQSTIKVDGCDAADPLSCLVGLAVTRDAAYEEFVEYVEDSDTPPFGNRLVGATSDYTGTSQYSVQFQPQNVASGGLGYEMLKSLGAYAKTQAQADGCYINRTNDDTSANDTTPGDIVLSNRTLGTVADPKICFVEVPFIKTVDGKYVNPKTVNPSGVEDAYFTGVTKGAGILVVLGEVELPSAGSSFDYDGIIVTIGPTAELESNGMATIRGAAILGTTDPMYKRSQVTGLAIGGPKWIEPEFQPRGKGFIQYDSQAVAAAQGLLSGWTGGAGGGSSTSGVAIEAWSYD